MFLAAGIDVAGAVLAAFPVKLCPLPRSADPQVLYALALSSLLLHGTDHNVCMRASTGTFWLCAGPHIVLKSVIRVVVDSMGRSWK
jgi:hypothetical protein